MTDANKAVFLSYASQDAPAVLRIAEALRTAGVEVWFDQNELVGGDAWDQKIRKQIKACALFVPVISANTNARAEGYFRLEWKLAVDRSHLMADDAPFLFPVVIDDTADATARVPDRFRDVQWTRLNVKDTPESLAKRVARLLGAAAEPAGAAPAARGAGAPVKRGKSWMKNIAMIGGILIGLIYAIRGAFEPRRTREPKPAVEHADLTPAAKPAATVSEARQLALRARLLFEKIDSNADDFAVAESLLKRALELDSTDGEIWAYSARLNSAYSTRSFDRGTARAEASRSQAERAVKLAPESAEAWHALGRSQFLTDPPRAEEALRHAVQLAPNDGHILISLGSVCRLQGRLDEALAFYTRAAAQPEVKTLALYDQFLIHLYQRRFAEADRCVRDSIAGMPTTNNVTGLAMLEIAWRGRIDAAQRTLAEAPTVLRAEPRMVFMSALVALMAKQTADAVRALDRLPGDFISDAWYSGPKALLVGLAHTQAGRSEAARIAWEAGVAVVRRRLQESSNDPELHLRLGELLAWTGQTDAALREARVFEELQRGRGDLTYSSARIYAALGRAAETVPILEKFLTTTTSGRWPLTPAILRLDPLWDKIRDDPRFQALCAEPAENATPATLSEGAQLAARALALITKVGFTRDDLAPAEDFARRATDKEPDSASAWGVRAGVQSAWLFRGWDTSDQRRQDTQALANRALALDPNEPEALLALGHVLRTQRAGAQAVAHLRRAIAANPDHVRLVRALGYTLSMQGRNKEARAVLQDAVKRAPRDPLLRYELAMTYLTYGGGGTNPDTLAGALEQLDQAIAIQPFASALILKATLIGGWRGDLPAMRAVLDQVEKLPLAERAEDRSVCIAMWAGLLERRPDRVEAAAAVSARTYFDDAVMPLPVKAWSLALAHRQAGKENLARADWQAAEAVLRQRLKDDPANETYQVELAVTLAWLGRNDEATQLVAPIEPVWKERDSRIVDLRLLAMYYAAAGDAAKAAPYLARELDRTVFTTHKMIRLTPWWDKIRGSPEFEALLAEPKSETTSASPPPPPDLSAVSSAQALATADALVKVDAKSVAVLAFANLSDDKANEYFSDGISEELLNVLAKVPKLKVAARTSSFYFKGQNAPIPEIAQKLGVAYVVEGSVRKAGNKVRITAQLIKAADGFHVWSETYDRELQDIFAVQDEIAKNILTAVKGSLMGEAELPHAITTKIEAYTLYLQAQGAFAKRGDTNLREAIRLYEAALAIDPNHVSSLIGLAQSRTLLPNYAVLTGTKVHEFAEGAMHAARRALELEPQNAAAHAVIGYTMGRWEWRWSEGVLHMLRARDLAPNEAWSWNCVGDYYFWVGDFPQAVVAKQRQWALDPLSPACHWDLSNIYLVAGNYDQAIHWSKRAAVLAPQIGNSYLPTLLAACRTGRWELVRTTIAEIRQNVHEGDDKLRLAKAYCAIMERKPAEARQILAEVPPLAESGKASPAYLGFCHLLLGESDQAVVWLRRAYDQRDEMLVMNSWIDLDVIAANPITRPIVDLPGLKELYELRQQNARAGLNKL